MNNAERARQRDQAEEADAKQAAVRRAPLRRAEKSATAFRTISEVADDLEVPQHVLRFWETKFPQIRPMKRGGGRRYYRPEDVDLLRTIRNLLYDQGYTIKGVQKLMREGGLRMGDEPALAGDGAIDGMADPQLAAEIGQKQAVMDLPLFRAALDEGQLREIKAAIAELVELRDRLQSAIGD